MKLSIKNLAIVGAVIAAIAGGIWLAKPSEASVCDGWINVITCGTPSHQDLKNVYYGRNDIGSSWHQMISVAWGYFLISAPNALCGKG